MRVRYTPEAFADRERIFEYLREKTPFVISGALAFVGIPLAAYFGKKLIYQQTEYRFYPDQVVIARLELVGWASRHEQRGNSHSLSVHACYKTRM